MEFYVGLPVEHQSRVSPMNASLSDLQTIDKTAHDIYCAYNDPRVHRAEIPGANGITNARSLARLYASLIGELDGGRRPRLLKESILSKAITSNTPIGEVDYVFQTAVSIFGMGFWLFDQTYPFPGSKSFGFGGNLDSSIFISDHSVCFLRGWGKSWFCYSGEESFLWLCDESIYFSKHRWDLSPIRQNPSRNSEQSQLRTFDLDFSSFTEQTVYYFSLSQTNVFSASIRDQLNLYQLQNRKYILDDSALFHFSLTPTNKIISVILMNVRV
jgi:hypothetical protein